MILSTGINNNTGYPFNCYNNYTCMYYSNSNAKNQLESWYNTNLSSYSNYIATGNYFCEQAKVKYSSSYTSGSASMAVYTSYTPNFKCSTDGNGKGLVNTSIGLITYDELVFAGGYYGKSNTSYYLYKGTYYWTMSPAGVDVNNPREWYVDNNGDFYVVDTHNYTIRFCPIINLNAKTRATGSGTSSNPYIVK